MAINKTQITVLEKVPVLFKRQILNLVTKHNTYLMNRGFINYRPYTEFEELFMNLNSNTLNHIIDIIIKRNFDVYIDIYSPKEIFLYPVLIDYILNKDISYIEYLEEDIITDKHISLLAEKDNTILYLVNKDKLPLKALKNSKILELVLQEVSFDKYLELLDAIEEKYPAILPKALDIGAKRGFFNKYDSSMHKYLTNSNVLKAIKQIDLNDILDIYQTNPSLGIKVFLTFIKENKIVGAYNPEKNKDLSLFDHSEVLHALASEPNLKTLDSFLTQIDVVKFSINDLVNIINRFKDDYFMEYPRNFFNNYLCLKLSIENKEKNAFVGFNEKLIKRYLLETTNYLDLNNNFEGLLYCIQESNIKPIENSYLLADYLTLLISKRIKETEYLEIFTESSYTPENIDKYIEYINSLTSYYVLPDQLLHSKLIYTQLLHKCTNPAVIIQAEIQDISAEELDIIVSKIKTGNTKYYIMADTLRNNSLFFMKLLNEGITNSSLFALFNKNIYTKEVINEIYNKNKVSTFEKIKAIPINSISNLIEVNKEDINKVISLPNNDDTLVRCLMILSKIKNNKNQLDSVETKCQKILLSKNLPEKEVNLYLREIKKGTKDPLTALYIKSKKNLLFALYISDYYYDYNSEYINSIPNIIIEKINSKHLKEIIKLLGINDPITIHLALNIYLTIGYERALNLLSPDSKKNYGPIDIRKISAIFNSINLNNITFVQDGHGYLPELNEEWIDLIFGKNNKVKNTPIRNYLNDYEDKKEEIDKNNSDASNNNELSREEKERIFKKNELLYEKYIQNNHYFMNNASNIFNNWDAIKEEYLKVSNTSKLKVKMNPAKIVEVLNNFNALKTIDYDEVEDEELLKSDVFDYVGKDNKYITQPALVPSRILELSREMNSIKTKKFPDIRLNKGNFILKTYSPQDRGIFSAGFKYDCCFRPNGNADNPLDEYRNPIFTTNGHSKDSFLRYCSCTEYGGCIEIIDITGKPVLFSPIIRSGNVLMIHSIETKEELLPVYYELIIQYANRVIEESIKNNDNIDFVLLGYSSKVDRSYFKEQLPYSKKFQYYNVNDEYNYMYNNLDSLDHLVVATRKNKKLADIHYGEVEHSYSYSNNYYNHSCIIDNNLLVLCQELETLNNQYIDLSNKRFMAKENNNDHDAYELLTRMKKIKKHYLNKYNEVLKRKRGIDYYKVIKTIIRIMSSLNNEITIRDLMEFSEIYYGKDWYVAITKDKRIICDSTTYSKEAMQSKLKELKQFAEYKVSNGSVKS